jgi:hypothetical protein
MTTPGHSHIALLTTPFILALPSSPPLVTAAVPSSPHCFAHTWSVWLCHLDHPWSFWFCQSDHPWSVWFSQQPSVDYAACPSVNASPARPGRSLFAMCFAVGPDAFVNHRRFWAPGYTPKAGTQREETHICVHRSVLLSLGCIPDTEIRVLYVCQGFEAKRGKFLQIASGSGPGLCRAGSANRLSNNLFSVVCRAEHQNGVRKQ